MMKETKYDPRLGVYTEMRVALATVMAFNAQCRENGWYGGDENQRERFFLTGKLLEAEAKLAEFDNQYPAPPDIIRQRKRVAEQVLEATSLIMKARKLCFTDTETDHCKRQIADADKRLEGVRKS